MESLDKPQIFGPDDFKDYDYNVTDDPFNYNSSLGSAAPCYPHKVQSFDKIFLPVFYSIIFILGALGNGMVIAVLIKRKDSLIASDIYILHLAVSDILLVVTLPFWAAQAVHGWIFGTGMCKIIGCIFKINFYCGIFLLGLISFGRYLSIVHAIEMHNRRKTMSVTLTCLTVWAFCILIIIPDFIFLDVVHNRETHECVQNFSSLTAKNWRVSLSFIHHIIGFFVPFIIMVYCYYRIFKNLCYSQRLQKQKALRVIIAVVIVFFLCWAPYNLILFVDTLTLLKIFTPDCKMESSMDISKSVTQSFGYFHACLNPFLYAFIGIKFRNNFLDIIIKIGCISQQFIKKYLKDYKSQTTCSNLGDSSNSGL